MVDRVVVPGLLPVRDGGGGEPGDVSSSRMDVLAPRFPTSRERRSLPGSLPLAVTSTLLLGIGFLAGGSVRAAARVRKMRARGRQVPAVDHDTALPGSSPARRLAVVGDSAAAGHGLSESRQAYTHLVASELHRRDGRATTVTNVAVDGATVGEVIADQLDAVRGAELVIVGVGVNDAIRRHRPSRVRREMDALFAGIHERVAPGATVVLISTPDLCVAPGLPTLLRPPLGVLCRSTARAQAEVAEAWGVPVVALPRQVLPPEVFGDDGFHPGAVGHARLAEGVLARLGELEPSAG